MYFFFIITCSTLLTRGFMTVSQTINQADQG